MVSISKTIGRSLNVFNDFSFDPEIPDSAMFQLQTIVVNGVKINFFFGSGCGDLIVKKTISHELSGTESFNDKFGFDSSQIADTLLTPNAYAVRKPPKCLKQFDQIECAGTEVTYRCVECSDCLKCKNGSRVDALSIQDEVEQSLIDRLVEVDEERGRTIACLPFVVVPDSRFGPSE